MEVYELLRKLRVDRGISQKELADKITSRESLVKYENGKTYVPLIILMELLGKMNLELDEFLFYLDAGNEKRSSQAIKKLIAEIEESKKPSKHLLSKLKLIAKESQNIVDVRNYLVAKIFNWHLEPLSDRRLNIHDKLYVQIITKHLERVGEYGRFEITTFVSLLFLFSTEFINRQTSKIEKTITKHSDYEIFHSALCGLYNNAFLLMLERREIFHAKRYLEKLKHIRATMIFSGETEIYGHFYGLLLSNLTESSPTTQKELLDFFRGLNLICATKLKDEFLSDLRKYEKLYETSLLPHDESI
ncbi:XRE family transcriptional regulator [Listeria monocytogenes]|nr:XRE family transcriptional regulator [Listeria monocytogenes]